MEHWRAERESWDRLAAEMPDLLSAASTQYYRRREIALFQRYVGPLAGKRLLKLDLWNEAFNTRILNWASGQGANAFGLDASEYISRRAWQNARAAGDSLHVVQADIRRLPFADESFDLVYSMGTIEHIAEYREALAEVRRVLRVGGRAIIGVPHTWNVFLRPLLVVVLTWLGKYPYAPERSFGGGELRRLVEGCGLRVLARTGILTIPGAVRMADLFLHRAGSRLQRLTALLVRPFEALKSRFAWSGRFGYLVVMVAEKPERRS